MSDSLRAVQPATFLEPSGAKLRWIPEPDESMENPLEVMEHALIEVWKEVGKCFAYPKADGWRIQIHKQGNEVKLYSRRGIDYAETFPSIVQMTRTHVRDDEVILDIELVGFNQYGQHLEPWKIENASQFRCYLLDALYLDGKDLTLLPARERIPFIHERLQSTFDGNFTFAEYKSIECQDDLIKFYKECRERRKEGFDGTIIKRLNKPYSAKVLKLKSEEPIDAVVVAAYRKKQGELVSLLLAVPCLKYGRWIPITKVSRTVTDWEAVWPACQPYIRKYRPSNLDDPPNPPAIWIAPEVVVSVNVRKLTRSEDSHKRYQVYGEAPTNCVLRKDKGPNEATSFEQVLQMVGLTNQTEILRKESNHLQSGLFGDYRICEDEGSKEFILPKQVSQIDSLSAHTDVPGEKPELLQLGLFEEHMNAPEEYTFYEDKDPEESLSLEHVPQTKKLAEQVPLPGFW